VEQRRDGIAVHHRVGPLADLATRIHQPLAPGSRNSLCKKKYRPGVRTSNRVAIERRQLVLVIPTEIPGLLLPMQGDLVGGKTKPMGISRSTRITGRFSAGVSPRGVGGDPPHEFLRCSAGAPLSSPREECHWLVGRGGRLTMRLSERGIERSHRSDR